MLRRGGVPYRDFWDIKQPGIFCFYLLGGSLFGFDETGIYGFESLYLLVFSVILILTLARYFASPVVAACLPLFTVAFYYAVVGSWHRIQVEGLVGLPLFLTVSFAVRAEESDSLSPFLLFLSGLCGGIVLLFKFVFLPILVVIWLPIIVYRTKKTQSSGFTYMIRSALCVLGGAELLLLITVAYFSFHETLYLFLWTTFGYPKKVVTTLGHVPLYRLLECHDWFFARCASSLALAVVALLRIASSRIDPLNRSLLLWIISGYAVIQLQVRSWYTWHYLLLFVPLGILAARGVDVLWTCGVSQWGGLRRVRFSILLILVVFLLYVHPIYTTAVGMVTLVRDGIPTTSSQIREIQRSRSKVYAEIENETKFLRDPSSKSGPIYICGGNVLYYRFSGRRAAIPLNATVSPLFLPERHRVYASQ